EETVGASFSAFRRAGILIVDSSATYRAYLQEMLSREGYDVTHAAQRNEAITLVSTRPAAWDCVIVNILSPDFDGIELCRQLNTYRSAASLPGAEAPSFYIVGLGNEEGSQSLSEAFAAGVDDIIPASMEPDVMR
ncbi:response regulator, partial [Corallococcus exiguus]|uniref:response regulator n=1 Tax=Corallococcus exiguus TaxID=83462 RepID=UPI0014726DE4